MGLREYMRNRRNKKEESFMVQGYGTSFSISEIPDSLTNSSFWSCVVNLSRLYATLPLHAYQMDKDGSSKQMEDDRLLSTILTEPCPNMSAYQWRYIMGFNFEMHGVAMAIIERSRSGLPIHLYPVSPASMVGHWKDGELYFLYSSEAIDFPAKDILQIYNTPTGYGTVLSPLDYARNDLELEAKCKKMQSEYYNGGSIMGKIIKVPSNFNDAQMDSVKAKFDSARGYRNMVISDRISVEQIQIPSSDISRLTEAQKWSSAEVARRFNVPLFFLGDSSVTYGNAEQQGLQMGIYCLNPRVKAWEMAFKQSICQEDQYIKFSLEGLMRGDHAARSAFYHNAIMDGWMSINEVRAKEDMSPTDDGDTHFFPMNYASLGDVASGKYTSNPSSTSAWDIPDEEEKNERAAIDFKEKRKHDLEYVAEATAPARSARAKLQALVRKQLKAEIAKMRELIATGQPVDHILSDFAKWLNENAAEVQPQYKEIYLGVLKGMMPVVAHEVGTKRTVSDEKMDAYANEYSSSLVSRHQGRVYTELSTVVGTEEFDNKCTDLQDDMPVSTAEEEVQRSSNAFSVFLYSNLGVQWMHIVAAADACPFCGKMDGKIASVDGYFLNKDTDEDDGEGGVRHISKNYRHPPFHSHCSCNVAPGK